MGWLMDLLKEVATGSPVVILVLAVVQWFKLFKTKDGNQLITGNGLLIISLLVGLALGILLHMATVMPVGYSGWIQLVIAGLIYGLVASGVFDVIKAASSTPPTPPTLYIPPKS